MLLRNFTLNALKRMRPLSTGRRDWRGLTLAEVLIAFSIFGFLSVVMLAALMVARRQAERNNRHLHGLQVASYYESLVRSADFDNLGLVNPPNGSFEDEFTATEANPIIDESDPTNLDRSKQYEVWFEHTGWGQVSAAADNTLTADFAANQSPWEDGEWIGHHVVINAGLGQYQIMKITDNDANTLTVTADLTGVDDTEPWYIIPDNTSSYLIGNGKTVRIWVEWTATRSTVGNPPVREQLTRSVLLPWDSGS